MDGLKSGISRSDRPMLDDSGSRPRRSRLLERTQTVTAGWTSCSAAATGLVIGITLWESEKATRSKRSHSREGCGPGSSRQQVRTYASAKGRT